jgi:hypothetical protein
MKSDSEPAKAEASPDDRIVLFVKAGDGSAAINFKVKRSTKFRKIFDAYGAQTNVEVRCSRVGGGVRCCCLNPYRSLSLVYSPTLAACVDAKNSQVKYLRFYYEGMRLKDDATPAEYEIEDKSEISVMNEQVGGRCPKGR